ncbi:hypothetical protein FQR65_LT19204 [Abscondita terminalis]|nr:hypothetical protein FQR65_LT19204 [Abscondita terminalis]
MGTSSDKIGPVHELLNEISSVELNDRIISLPSFLCKKCDKFLLPPIRLIEGVGNVCGKCELQDPSKTILHNSALEIILQNLAIPCPNKSRGCKEYFEYYDILSHLSTCSGRNYNCPYKVLENCEWEGASSSILIHCFEKHPENVLQPTNGSFQITIDINTTKHVVSLLVIGNDKFIMHIKCDIESSSLYYVMYYMDVDVENALKIDLPLLEQFASGSTIETVFKIIPKNNKTDDIDETLLTIFECPICNNYMKPPIFQCLSGHSLCNHCRPKLGQCPTCRTGFGNTRNYSLETLSHRTKFPCLYRELGCRIVMSASEINKHEIECDVKPYGCPFLEVKKCFWEGSFANIAPHLTLQHSDKTKFTNVIDVRAIYSYESTSDLYCMIYNGDIFRVCHKYDRGSHNVYWAVQYVGPKAEAKNYKFEISLLDARNENRKLVRADVCQELTNYDSMFKQAIILPLNLLTMFSTGEGITYSCKIGKIDI